LRQELARARDLWASAGSDSYSYTYSAGNSFGDITVRDGVASLVEGTLTDPPTIPELFDRIEDSLETYPASVTYDPVLGYPREAVASVPCDHTTYWFYFAVTDLVLE
jgi:hypothetical protein